MKKDVTLKVFKDCTTDEEILVLSPDIAFPRVWLNKANITDEDGNYLSWYFHPVFKKLDKVHYDAKADRFWLPKADLINKTALKSLLKKHNTKLAFFNYNYAKAFLNGKTTKKHKGLSGLFEKGLT